MSSNADGHGAPKSPNAWDRLFGELQRRLFEPWDPPFAVYFLLGVIVFGGLGLWVEAFHSDWKPTPALLTSVLTFFPALVGSTSLQMVLEQSNDRSLRAFAVLVAFAFALFTLGIFWVGQSNPTAGLILGAVVSILGLLVWVIANADNPGFKAVATDAPVGGNPDTPPVGDLTGFQH